MALRVASIRDPRTTGKARNWLARMWRMLTAGSSGRVDSARHAFAIEHLGQPAGWFQPHRYRYFCVRCGWMFRVENRRGDAIAVGLDGAPLAEPKIAGASRPFKMAPAPP